jgi:hypothetical protein
MKNVFLPLLACTFLSACSISSRTANNQEINQSSQKYYQGHKQGLHVYILIGQSNMAGRAPLTAEQYNAIDNTFLFDLNGQWQLATNPLNRYSSIRKNIGMQKLGVGYSFANTMNNSDFYQAQKAKIGLVVNAKGGSSIKEWQPDKHFFKEAVKRIKQAQQTGVLKGILWHQGESDFEDADYLNKLTKLVKDLRDELNLADLPFVSGQINNSPLINQQIAELPNQLDSTAYVSSAGLTAMDRWHFDNDSMQKLGKGYAEAMLKLQ